MLSTVGEEDEELVKDFAKEEMNVLNPEKVSSKNKRSCCSCCLRFWVYLLTVSLLLAIVLIAIDITNDGKRLNIRGNRIWESSNPDDEYNDDEDQKDNLLREDDFNNDIDDSTEINHNHYSEDEDNLDNLVSTSSLTDDDADEVPIAIHSNMKNLLKNNALPDEFSTTDEYEDEEEFAHTAPRTSSLQYNELDPEQKYLLYTPSGGMTNQVLELINAMHMAQLLGRTLYFPMIGRHSNLVHGYNALKQSELFSADRLFV